MGLLAKRAYDVAGCASGHPGKALKVFLNGTRLSMASFQDVSTWVGEERGADFATATHESSRLTNEWAKHST